MNELVCPLLTLSHPAELMYTSVVSDKVFTPGLLQGS
jgi:hypothetical protein